MPYHNRKLSYQFIYELKPFEFDISDIAIAPNSQILASSEGIVVKLFELSTGRLIKNLKKRPVGLSSGALNSLAISPNGQFLAGACKKYSLHVWNLQTGEHLRFLKYNTEFEHDYTSVAFCADNVTLISGARTKTDTWNIHTGERSSGTNTMGYRLAISPNSHIIASDISRVEFSDLPRTRSPHSLKIDRFQGSSACVATVAITKDGQTCAGGVYDGHIIFWDWQTYAELLTIEAHKGVTGSIAFNKDGQVLVSGGDDKLIKFWNVSNGQLLGTIEGHTGRVYGVAWSPDGRFLASYDSDKNIKVWRISLF
ncbi:MAG: hypothetical protein WBG70_02535 [Spirulinaceae cyanobacterium]